MTEKNLLNTHLQIQISHALKQVLQDVQGNSKFGVFLFGSARVKRRPRDIDILVVYDQKQVTNAEVKEFCNLVRGSVTKRIRLPVDLCRLSKVEASQNPFIHDEKCILLWPDTLPRGWPV